MKKKDEKRIEKKQEKHIEMRMKYLLLLPVLLELKDVKNPLTESIEGSYTPLNPLSVVSVRKT